MNAAVQYIFVGLIVVVAAVSAFRILTGRRALRRGKKEDSCAGCSSADQHRH